MNKPSPSLPPRICRNLQATLFSLHVLLVALVSGTALRASPIFPEPRSFQAGAAFPVTRDTVITFASAPTEEDLRAARVLSADLADRYGVGVPILSRPEPDRPHAILLGRLSHEVIRSRLRGMPGEMPAVVPEEGYALRIDGQRAGLAGARP